MKKIHSGWRKASEVKLKDKTIRISDQCSRVMIQTKMPRGKAMMILMQMKMMRGKAMMQEKKRESCETEAKLNRNCKLDQTWDIFVTPQIFILQT